MDSFATTKSVIIKHQDIIAAICFTITAIILLWKAPYGIGIEDESAYLTGPFRFLMGDSFLTDEWHLAQFFTLLIYLPYKAYIFFVGSTEGVILFFRYLFVFFQSAVSIIIYLRLRKYGLFSILAALVFYLHIPLINFMMLGYYNLGISFYLLAGLLILTAKKHTRLTFFTIGLLIACAVLCNPLLAIVYFAYSICMILHETTQKKKHNLFKSFKTTFSFKIWFWITAGISTLATVFFVFLFSRTNLKELIENIPMLFTDPQYVIVSERSNSQNVFTIYDTILEMIKINPYLFFAYSILTAAIVFDKKRMIRRPLYMLICAIIFFIYIVDITSSIAFWNYGYWMFPLALLGLTSYILSENKNRAMFVWVWLWGVIYAVCLDISSALGFSVSSMGFVISNVASVLFIRNIINELQKQNIFKQNKKKPYIKHKNSLLMNKISYIQKFIAFTLTATLFFQVFQEIYLIAEFKFYYEYVILDSNSSFGASIQEDSKKREKLDVILENGPQKGLKTTASRSKIYYGLLSDLSTITENGYGPILIAGKLPWCYLYLDMPIATYSTWFMSDWISYDIQKLKVYYNLHPDKYPKIIYIPKIYEVCYSELPDRTSFILGEFVKNFRCTVDESNYGYTLEITN